MSGPFHRPFSMGQHWLNSEIRELLIIRVEEEVRSEVSGTVRDAAIYKYLAHKLRQRGHGRTPKQVSNKLKALKKKYPTLKDKAQLDWQFYELCDNIFRTAVPSSSMAGSSAVSPPSQALSGATTAA